MHSQSDYGYTVGGIEARDLASCLKQQSMCRELASKYAAAKTPTGDHYAEVFKRQAQDWQREIDFYRQIA